MKFEAVPGSKVLVSADEISIDASGVEVGAWAMAVDAQQRLAARTPESGCVCHADRAGPLPEGCDPARLICMTKDLCITVDEHGFDSALWPALRDLLPKYTEIQVEVAIENGFSDIVAERFDAGVRHGGTVAKDMIAMPIGPDLRMVAVAAPAYLAGKALPRKPQDLTEHACVNLRLSTRGGIYAWEFEKRGREIRVWVDGQFIVNGIAPMLLATLDGCGVGYLPLDLVQPHLDKGQLVQLLSDWTPPFSGYHLYYPSRRQPTAAFKVLLETLRLRAS